MWEMGSRRVGVLSFIVLLQLLQTTIIFGESARNVSLYTYEVVAEYPHDPDAFTQGIQFDHYCDDGEQQCRDIFWESTGLNGRSSARMVDVATGGVLQSRALDTQWFGEGITKHGNKLYQITWQTPTGFTYSADSGLQLLSTFSTPLRDGWGITSDGTHLILTDGSNRLTWVDPETMAQVKTLDVTDGEQPIVFLNEVEWIHGEVWANIWQTECIARICPESGKVKGWVLMHGLMTSLQARRLPQSSPMDVLNGIAHDPVSNRTFVTGKLWPRVFEVKLQQVPHRSVSKKLRERRRSCYSQGWGALG